MKLQRASKGGEGGGAPAPDKRPTSKPVAVASWSAVVRGVGGDKPLYDARAQARNSDFASASEGTAD